MNQHKVVTHEVYLFLPLKSDAVTQDETGHYLHLGAPALHLLERLPLPFHSRRGTASGGAGESSPASGELRRRDTWLAPPTHALMHTRAHVFCRLDLCSEGKGSLSLI